MVPSGIDKEKIMLQLGRLEEHLSRLRDISNRIEKTNEDAILLPAGERLLQTAIEECLNIGGHLISGLALPRADTYREIFTRLKEAGILSEKLAKIMERFASFRNRLVHIYYEVNKEEVILKLKEIDHLKEFARQVIEYTERK